MSGQQPPSYFQPVDATYDASIATTEDVRDQEPIPAFRSFPARVQSYGHGVQAERVSGRPPTGYSATQENVLNLPFEDSNYRPAVDDNRVHASHSASLKHLTQREQTSTLPTLPPFAPFPVASRQSRYGPGSGSPVDLAGSTVPSTTAPESTKGPGSRIQPAAPPAPAPLGAATGSTLAARTAPSRRLPLTSRGSLPGQPSPYAPPGEQTTKPHVCELCNSCFARAHDLKRHVDTHKGDRPYKCPSCQRPFSRKDAVQRHLLVTHCGGDPSSNSTE